jgi:hypothetical protein
MGTFQENIYATVQVRYRKAIGSLSTTNSNSLPKAGILVVLVHLLVK